MSPIEELMQLAIDGQIAPEQERELQAALDRSAEAREMYGALQQLARALDSVPMIDPPEHVALSRVLRDAPLTPASRTLSPTSGERDYVGPRPAKRRWFAFAYAAAAVLVIALAIRHTVPPKQTSAAMLPVEPVIERVTSGNATLIVRGTADEFTIEVTPNVRYAASWDRTKLLQTEPNRFRRIRGASGLTVIRLRLPDKTELAATIDLR